MAEKPLHEFHPRNLFTSEQDKLDEPDTIDEVRRERLDHQDQVKAARDLITNLGPNPDDADIETAYEFFREARDRLASFDEMWQGFGGDAVDVAQAKVDAAYASDPTSTRFDRAKQELLAAENTFAENMNNARGMVLDHAHAMNDVETAKQNTTLGEIEDAHDEAIAEWQTRERGGYFPGTMDEAHQEALDTDQEEMDAQNQRHAANMDNYHQEALDANATETASRNQRMDALHQEAIDTDVAEMAAQAQRHADNMDAMHQEAIDTDAAEMAAQAQRHAANMDAMHQEAIDTNDAEMADQAQRHADNMDAMHQEAIDTDQAEMDAQNQRHAANMDAVHAQAIADWEAAEGRTYDRNFQRRGLAMLRHRVRVLFRRGIDAVRSPEHRTRNIIIGVGAVAAVGTALYFALRHGDSSGLTGNGVGGGAEGYGLDNGSGDQYGLDNGGSNNEYGLDNNGGLETGTDNGAEATPTLPEFDSSTQDYPFDWVKDAFPGLSDSEVMDKTRELGRLAEDNGYNVEWHTTRGGKEWIEINGNDSPKYIVDIFRAVANK